MKSIPLKIPVRGFSLVEVVLALGICSFAMVAIFGMIPIGLSTFRDAMDTTAQSQIVQRLASDTLLTDYGNLANLPNPKEPYCYNDQGARTGPEATDLAYTAEITIGDIAAPGTISEEAVQTVVIRIARTHPGQTFATVEKNFPNQIYSYPIVVANAQSID